MYAGVPTTCPTAVSVDAVFSPTSGSVSRSRRASPKSSTFSSPSGVSARFPGFRSRWITPCSCAA